MKFAIKIFLYYIFFSSTILFCEKNKVSFDPVVKTIVYDKSTGKVISEEVIDESQEYGDRQFKDFVDKIKDKIGLEKFKKNYLKVLKFGEVDGEYQLLFGSKKYKKSVRSLRGC